MNHIPVMLEEAIAALSLSDGKLLVDCTFGAGGYSREILKSPNVQLLGLDRDPSVKEAADELLQERPGRFAFRQIAFSALEQGNLEYRITASYEGLFDDSKQAANNTSEKLQLILNLEIAPVLQAAQAGDLSQRVILKGKEGFYKELGKAVNQLLESTEQAIQDTVEGLKALEAGDLTHRIQRSYEGSFDTIKQASNNTAEK